MAKRKTRRDTIIAAAAQAFDANGYSATTVDQVAAKAGISKGNIYNYFHSKEELFQQVFLSVVAGLEADASQALAEPLSPSEKIRTIIDYHGSTMDQSQRIGRLVLEFWATAAREQRGELATTLRQVYDRWHRQLADVIADGISRGQFRPDINPQSGAALISALLDGIDVQSILGFGLEPTQQNRDSLERAVMAAVLVKDQS